MLRNAATGVAWLRSLVGIGGVVMLLALLLPMVGRVLICRLVCTLGADAASWLGCPTEGKLLSEVGSIYGYLLAVVSLSSITFFFSLLFNSYFFSLLFNSALNAFRAVINSHKNLFLQKQLLTLLTVVRMIKSDTYSGRDIYRFDNLVA
jgi:hypothetical protein